VSIKVSALLIHTIDTLPVSLDRSDFCSSASRLDPVGCFQEVGSMADFSRYNPEILFIERANLNKADV